MDGDRVSHAQMAIHGQRVYLNDRFGNRNRTQDCAAHIVVTFETTEALMACFNIMSEGGQVIDPLRELPYSPLAGNFMDRFGVIWGFMVA